MNAVIKSYQRFSQTVSFLLIAVLFPLVVFSDTAPSISVLQPIFRTKLYFNDTTGAMNAEATPWALESARANPQGGWHTFLITTSDTFMCSTPNDIFGITGDEQKIIDTHTCHLRQSPAINGNNDTSADTLPSWKFNYYGAVSGHILQTGPNASTLYSINHGELENAYPDQVNGIPSCTPAPDIGYGKLPCDPTYAWGSYNAFIGLSSFPWTLNNLSGSTKFTDLGPLTWPSNGYVESLGGANVKATDGGVRHPSSIIKDGCLYIFYDDLSQGSESDGRGPGIKVVRAPITASGVDPQSFLTYYNGAFTDKALPTGFQMLQIRNFFASKGGRTSSLFPSNIDMASPTPGTKRTDNRRLGDIISFSVAKVNGTNWYMSVGYELSKGVTLRLSQDLVNWGDPIVVPGTEYNYFTQDLSNPDRLQYVPFLYPRLANADGDSNIDIDSNDFYIIGTQTAQHGTALAKIVNAIHLKLNLPAPLPTVTLTACPA